MQLIKDLYQYYLIGFPSMQEEYDGYKKLKEMCGNKLDLIADNLDFQNQHSFNLLKERFEGDWEMWTWPYQSFLYIKNLQNIGFCEDGEENYEMICVSLISNYYSFFRCKKQLSLYIDEYVLTITEYVDEDLLKSIDDVVNKNFEDASYISPSFLFSTIVEGAYPYTQDYELYKLGTRWPLFDYLFFDSTSLAAKVILEKK
jgi:hypothetical protein